MENSDKQSTYYQINKEKMQKRSRDWYRNNPELGRAQQAAYRKRHPEKIKAYKQRPEVKERLRLKKRASDAAKRAAGGDTPAEKRVNRSRHLKRLYGMSLDEYDALLLAQNGVCAICKGTQKSNRWKTDKLYVDHCHVTNRVRGLLCGNCNLAVGLVVDSCDRLRAMISYLETNVVVF